MDTYPTCSFVVGKRTNCRFVGRGGESRGRGSGQQWSRGHSVTLVGKRTNSRFVGWGRGHVVVSSGQGVILTL